MRVTWWGHATSTLELGGVRVLTDPVLTARVAHLHRVAVAPRPEAAEADVVVVSHLHADHLHVRSLRRLADRTRLVLPQGARALLERRAPELAARAEEVSPGETVTVGSVTITAVPARHDGHRLPHSRYHGPALGFVLEGSSDDGRERVWFAGDTGLFDGMHDIGPVDLAVVPVGGWGPTLGPEHLDPAEAAEAVERVQARYAVPVHYGTLWPTGLKPLAPALFRAKCREPGERFAAALGPRARVLAPGGTAELGG